MDDARLARELADLTGRRLLEVRASGLEGDALRAAGDATAQETLSGMLRDLRPADAVLSEEAPDDSGRLSARRVWIVDPLDGTREFAEPPRADWAVHVALWQDGDLVCGAVALPAMGTVFWTGDPPPLATPRRPLTLAVSRSRPPAFVQDVASDLGAQVVPMGSAGVKVMSVLRGDCDVYIHAGGQYEWDSAAPVVVARCAGLHTSRVDGSPLVYNRRDPRLPDLVVCHPRIADEVLSAVARQLDEVSPTP